MNCKHEKLLVNCKKGERLSRKFIIGRNRTLELNCIIEAENSAVAFEFVLNENSTLNLKNNITGKGNAFVFSKIILEGKGSSAFESSIFSIFKNAKLEIKSELLHKAEKTTAFSLTKGAVFESANANVDGNSLIEKNACNANSFIEQKVILAGKDANAKTFPNLEIYNNNVKAGHSARVFRIDEEAVFYMKSRSIEEKKAKDFLIKGFLEDLGEPSHL